MKLRREVVVVGIGLWAACFGFLTPERKGEQPLRIAASIFPLYDFARTVVGERGEVFLVLPPGSDVHSWQPRPRDVVRLYQADLLIHIGSGLEPWLDALLKDRKSFRGRILEAGAGLAVRRHGREEGGHAAEAADPHVWLNFPAAEVMVGRIREALELLDPAGRETYRKRASQVVESLRRLDGDYAAGLRGCRSKTFVLGGHAAFGYLADRYGLEQAALFGPSPDAEPTARQIARLVERMRRERLTAVFYEVQSNRKLAETLAAETGAVLLELDPAGNPSPQDFARGVSFLEIMRRNLVHLKKGLGCE